MQQKHHGLDLQVDGLTYRRTYHPQRDVDYNAVLKLLLKFNANPRLVSPLGKMPIFLAIKQPALSLQTFIEWDNNRKETINTVNRKNWSPLCKVASKFD